MKTPQAEYERKLSAAIEELKATGIWRANYAPPSFRLMRYFGLRVRPPLYVKPWRIFVSCAIWFGFSWGCAMWLIEWRGRLPPETALAITSFAGLLFGAMMTFWYTRNRRKYRLSNWEDL